MKKFQTPRMTVLKLEMEDLMTVSAGGKCWESFECKNCYCTAVTCDPVYECNALVCPGLDLD